MEVGTEASITGTGELGGALYFELFPDRPDEPNHPANQYVTVDISGAATSVLSVKGAYLDSQIGTLQPVLSEVHDKFSGKHTGGATLARNFESLKGFFGN